MDPTLSRALNLMHSKSKDSQEQLRSMLEEAIKKRCGSNKKVQANIYIREIENSSKPFLLTTDDSEQSQRDDDDLALERNLMVEDLACVVCRGIDVVARNQLIECSECHSLYHQECHQPPVSEAVMDHRRPEWACLTCTNFIKEMKTCASGEPESASGM